MRAVSKPPKLECTTSAETPPDASAHEESGKGALGRALWAAKQSETRGVCNGTQTRFKSALVCRFSGTSSESYVVPASNHCTASVDCSALVGTFSRPVFPTSFQVFGLFRADVCGPLSVESQSPLRRNIPRKEKQNGSSHCCGQPLERPAPLIACSPCVKALKQLSLQTAKYV